MARDLITRREGANAPSRPIIVQNVASLPAGAEISVNEATSKAGDVVPAGTPVHFSESGWYASHNPEAALIKGVLVNDCVAYEEDGLRFVTGAIMLIGVVNVDYAAFGDYVADASDYRGLLEGSPIVVIGKNE